MAEQDPREYRGGVREPEDANGGQNTGADTEGVVPREQLDDPPPQETSDPQALKDDALGEVTRKDPADDSIDRSAGDHADATEQGGTGADVDELDRGEPISRVDQSDLSQRTDKV